MVTDPILATVAAEVSALLNSPLKYVDLVQTAQTHKQFQHSQGRIVEHFLKRWVLLVQVYFVFVFLFIFSFRKPFLLFPTVSFQRTTICIV